MGRSKSLLIPFALVLAIVACDDTADDERVDYEYAEPAPTGDGWQTASLSDVGIDEARVAEGVRWILDGRYPQVHGLLIVRNGALVLEEYFDGNNRGGGFIQYGMNTTHDLASVTKSVTSIMTGLAIDNGFIGGVQEPALSYLPEYEHIITPQKGRITIEHLLTMTSGWEWSESTELVPENDMYTFNMTLDPIGFLIGKNMAAEPGEVWLYNGGAVTLLGKIIERASGLDLESFSEAYLFSPLGIVEFAWPYIKPDLIAAHGDLDLRPRDMAKLGQMMLSGGVWNQRRILPEEWVTASWRQAVTIPQSFSQEGYGYLWWMRSYGALYAAFCAEGWGGQRIIVLPELDTVVVFTGGNYYAAEPVETIMERHIVPAIAP